MARIGARWPLVGVLSGLVVLATGAPGATPAEAHPGRAPLVRLKTELGLSAEQVQAIREVRERGWEARRQTAKALQEARRALRGLVLGGGDEAAVQAKTAEVQRLVAEMVEASVKALQEVAQILTPEQRERLRELRPGWRFGRVPLAG